MNTAIAWFARNRVAANLLMAMLLVGGASAVPMTPQKTFPDIEIDVIAIGVEYLGAAPEEVEEGVCIRIEEEIQGIDGIEKIRSSAVEGACSVMAELISGADVSEVLDDIKNAVDAIDTFPEETEKPIIAQVTQRRPVIDVAISGDVDERTLKAIGERVRDEIADLPDVTQVELSLNRPFEVSIEVPEESLRRFGLSFDQVAAAVRRSSLDLPGGSVKTEGGEILLRTKGQAYRGADFEELVVVTRNDGTRLTLGEVAHVVDGFRDIDLEGRFDGEPAVMVHVYRVGDQDVIDMSARVKDYVALAQQRMPEGIHLTVWQDDSTTLRSRRDTLLENGTAAFFLVLLLLALFLQPRLAFWVTLGVPISFMGALWMFGPMDMSINVLTLFALIVVLGILVDDAVVVGENVHTRQTESGDRLRGSIQGTQEVAIPVIFGVLTTVVAFLPLAAVPGPMGQIFRIISFVVIICLLFSLVESQLILPAHLTFGRSSAGREDRRTHGWRRVQRGFEEGLGRFARGTYRRWLGRALVWRYATIAGAIALLLMTVSVVASGRIRFSFFPPIEADYLAARLTMPMGTPVEVTSAAARHIEESVAELRAQLDSEYAKPGGSLVLHVLNAVGAQPLLDRQSQGPTSRGASAVGGSHLAEVVLELTPSEERDISTSEVANHWREIVGPIPDAVELVFASDLFSVGEAINVQLAGANIDDLRRAAERVKQSLAQYPGVIDIADSFRSGKQEVKLAIRPSAEPLGLTMSDLARQVRQAFYGEEAQRVQRGRDDVRVMVRYPEHQRRSLANLENMRIHTPSGVEVPFGTVARAESGRGFATIRRTDRKRVVNVTADVDRTQTTANEVLANLQAVDLPVILTEYPSVAYNLEGEQREQRRAFSGLLQAYLVAILGIYALLAIPLRSYSQPLIIMSVIPFGLVGSIGGHLLLGYDLSFMSVIGIVALSGVVVNSSLVLVHYVNKRRAAGDSVVEAVTAAGTARFRAIFLTSATTFLGLTPLMLEGSMQAQFLIPMAISLAFGVVFATTITLLVVPCAYLVLEDLRGWIGSLGRKPAALETALDAREF